ncbi:MAG: hypothetical protein IJW16_06165 [Clostridia bacterium]|nr:hypothetical protein [Clostridia bacterium]
MTEQDLFRALSGVDPALVAQAAPMETWRLIVRRAGRALGGAVACLLALFLVMNIPNFIGYQSEDPNADPYVSSVYVEYAELSASYWRRNDIRPVCEAVEAIERASAPMPLPDALPSDGYRITVVPYEGETEIWLLTEAYLFDLVEEKTYVVTTDQYMTLIGLLKMKEGTP